MGTASLSFSIASSRQGILNRLATLRTTISTLAEATKSAGAQTYERVASLILTLIENSYRKGLFNRADLLALTLSSNSYRSAILNRLKTLIITIISGRSVYTPSEKMYKTCAVLWKFPRSDRIYLCIYNATTYNILIKGTDFHA